MRTLLSLLLLVGACGFQGKAAITLIGTPATNSQTSGTSVSFTIPAVTAGNGLLLTFGCAPNPCAITGGGVSGGGVTWVKVISDTTNRDAEIWCGINSTGSGTTISFSTTLTMAGSGGTTNVSQWNGLAGCAGAALDGTAAVNSGTSATPVTASITLTNPGSLIIAVERGGHAAFTSGPTNSFATLLTPTAASMQNAYYLPGATGPYSTGWTFGASAVYNTVIAGFKPAARGGGAFVIQ